MGQEASSSSRSLPSRFILVSSSPGILPPNSLLFSYLSHSVISLSSYEVLSSTTEKVPRDLACSPLGPQCPVQGLAHSKYSIGGG